MKTYLSIDLDYWHRSTQDSCTRFFQQVWAIQLPVYVVVHHHHLLPHMNDSDCDTLINIDHHSDLADVELGRILDFNEATWGNFVDWRHRGTFIWRYPTAGGVTCHNSQDPFAEDVSRWMETKKRLGLYGIPWKSVKAVGVSLSPDWIGRWDTVEEPLTKLHIRQWLVDINKEHNYKGQHKSHLPKFVRVK